MCEQSFPVLAPCVCFFVGCCLTSQQHASVSQGRICSDNWKCCHAEIDVTHQTFYLIQSQYTDTGPTSPSADPIMPVAWQGSHWSAILKSLAWLDPEKSLRRKRESNLGWAALEADALTTTPTRRSRHLAFGGYSYLTSGSTWQGARYLSLRVVYWYMQWDLTRSLNP